MLSKTLVVLLSLAVFFITNNNSPNQTIFYNNPPEEHALTVIPKIAVPKQKEAAKAPSPTPKSTETLKIQEYLFYQTKEDSGENSLWALDPGKEPIKILTSPGKKFYSTQQNQWLLIKSIEEDLINTTSNKSGSGVSLWIANGLSQPRKIAEGGNRSADFTYNRIFGNPPQILTSTGIGYDKKLVAIDLENFEERVYFSGFESYSIEYPRGELKTEVYIRANQSFPVEEVAWFKIDLTNQTTKELFREKRISVYPGFSQGKVLIKRDFPDQKSEIYLTDQNFKDQTLLWKNPQASNVYIAWNPNTAEEFALVSFLSGAQPHTTKTYLVINVLTLSIEMAPSECQKQGDSPAIHGGHLLACGVHPNTGPFIAFNLRTNETLPLLKNKKEGGPWANSYISLSGGKERISYYFSDKGYLMVTEPGEVTLERNQASSLNLKLIVFVREDALYLSDWKGEKITLIAKEGFNPRWLRLFQQNQATPKKVAFFVSCILKLAP